MERHNLKETEEYKKILAEMLVRSDGFFDSHKDEIAEDLRRGRNGRIAQRDEKK